MLALNQATQSASIVALTSPWYISWTTIGVGNFTECSVHYSSNYPNMWCKAQRLDTSIPAIFVPRSDKFEGVDELCGIPDQSRV